MSKTLDIESILQRMADRSKICQSSIEPTLFAFGKSPKITKANLRKATGYRGLMHYRSFCQEWLGWPDSLVDHLANMEQRVVWDSSRRNPHYLKNFTARVELCREAHVWATLAWIKEMAKP